MKRGVVSLPGMLVVFEAAAVFLSPLPDNSWERLS
jgi:hypothetical protein